MMIRGIIAAFALASMALLAGGCSQAIRPAALELEMSGAAKDGTGTLTIVVEVVGLYADKVDEAKSVKPKEWFNLGAPSTSRSLREVLPERLFKSFTFSKSKPGPHVLGVGDDFWKLLQDEDISDVLIVANPPTNVIAGTDTQWKVLLKADTSLTEKRVLIELNNGGLLKKAQPVKK